MPGPREALLAALADGRDHVLQAVDGLGEDELDQVASASGWTPRRMLSHLVHDVEVFWLQAVLGGEQAGIDRLCDGWNAPPLPGDALRATYREDAARGDAVLARTDLDAPPAWWPPPAVFGGPRLVSGWEVVHRVLAETSVHAGHLDFAREGIDGHQHLVVG